MSDPSIQDQIPLYALLSADERDDVEAYVAAHPEWAGALEEARALDELLQDARLLHRDPLTDEALAFYLAHHHIDQHAPSPVLQQAFERVEEQLEEHPELRERQRRMQQRLKELEAASDPIAQFERLTGHHLVEEKSAATGEREDRAPRRHARLHVLPAGWARWGIAAVLAVVVLYGVLLLVSRATEPELQRLAYVEADELRGYSTMRLRSASPAVTDTTAPDHLFMQAVDMLESAYRSHLGLFPTYDQAEVDRAAALLEQVIAREVPESFVRIEAYYFLGKARLAQNRPEEARIALQKVIDESGPRSGEAKEILGRMRQRYGGG